MSATQNSEPIFSGEFCHALDPKKRITIPSRWRKGEADEFFLIPGRANAVLRVMPTDQFRAVGEKAANDPAIPARDRAVFLRQFYSRARQVIADKQGRLVIPEEFCSLINLKGEIVLVGVHQTIELWNKAAWEATKQAEDPTFDRIAEMMGL
jgi:MraZ protein